MLIKSVKCHAADVASFDRGSGPGSICRVDLRRESRVTDDLDDITGDLVELDPAWTVDP
ncbi:hypothetical protein AB0L41_49835 [Amycolatopsis mediterranei]|uniref:hypothetical protein n=1 Tax=Amycolatopsis mediterranei TaxID=33910 RepID=UPI00341D2CEC